jgi:DNA-binding transcriptional ArsR family regulator
MSSRRPTLVHPPAEEIEITQVLHALSDPTRLTIVSTLVANDEKPCGTFPVSVSPSTLSHHFRVLREAGVIHQREAGSRRYTSLRRGDLEQRYPGLVDLVLAGAERDHALPPAAS